jgi:hypothetical protein
MRFKIHPKHEQYFRFYSVVGFAAGVLVTSGMHLIFNTKIIQWWSTFNDPKFFGITLIIIGGVWFKRRIGDEYLNFKSLQKQYREYIDAQSQRNYPNQKLH